MANEVNIYSPRYLAEVVRQAPPVRTYFRDTAASLPELSSTTGAPRFNAAAASFAAVTISAVPAIR